MTIRIDCHCDTPQFLLKHDSLNEVAEAALDFQGLRQYLDMAFYSIWVNQDEFADKEPEHFALIFNRLVKDICSQPDIHILREKEQLDNLLNGEKLLVLAMEGAAPLGRNCEHLDGYFDLGLRSIGLTWNQANTYASGIDKIGGLSEAGHDLVRRCNKMGILLDAAHLNDEGFEDLLEASSQPFIVTHTVCRSLNNTFLRSLTDEQMLALKAKGGVMGITFVPDFLGGKGGMEDLCRHIEYSVELIGSEHVALGSDFDGCEPVCELNEVKCLPAIYAELEQRGMSFRDIANVQGGSVFALLKRVMPSQKHK